MQIADKERYSASKLVLLLFFLENFVQNCKEEYLHLDNVSCLVYIFAYSASLNTFMWNK